MAYQIEYTSRFKKEYKLAKKRGRDINLLRTVIEILAKGEPLPEKYKDNELILSLTATGSHSDLF